MRTAPFPTCLSHPLLQQCRSSPVVAHYSATAVLVLALLFVDMAAASISRHRRRHQHEFSGGAVDVVNAEVCRACVARQRSGLSPRSVDAYKLERAKFEILRRLGMNEPPKFPELDLREEISRELVVDSLMRKELGYSSRAAGGSGGLLQHSRKTNAAAAGSGNQLTRFSAGSDDLNPDTNELLMTASGVRGHADASDAEYLRGDPGDGSGTSSGEDFLDQEIETVMFASAGPFFENQRLIQFTRDRNQIPDETDVISAELWLHLRFRSPYIKEFRKSRRDFRPKVFIFRVRTLPEFNASACNSFTCPPVQVQDMNGWELIGTLGVTLKTLGWQTIDLTAAIRNWTLEARPVPEANVTGGSGDPLIIDDKLTLLVDCAGCHGLIETGMPPVDFDTTDERSTKVWLKRRNFARDTNSAAFTPYFVIASKRSAKSRRKRKASATCPDDDDDGGSDDTDVARRNCCVRRLFVSFKDLGWDEWILYPDGYFANYCFGECREPNFAHFNTHVLKDYRNLFQGTDEEYYEALSPCCSPTKLSSISLIYYDQKKRIIKRDLPKMRVDECGCA